MQTSYYSRASKSNLENTVAISAGIPKWYKGRSYKKLAPPRWLIHEANESIYTKKYNELVLDKLDPVEVYNELGENAILLCWEKAGEFCHRRLVAQWFERTLGVVVDEYENEPNFRSMKQQTLF